MGKEKKKAKKGKKSKKAQEIQIGQKKQEYSLESMLSSEEKTDLTLDSSFISAKKTESSLQGLLNKMSEGKGFYRRESEEEKEEFAPQLSYDSKKSKVVEDYLMEEIPLSERKSGKKRSKIINNATASETMESEVLKSETIEKNKKLSIPAKEEPTTSQQEDIFIKLAKFFEELFIGYGERYTRWENSISNILSILRKMRKITKKNTEDLVDSINTEYDKIQINLDQFKLKRNEVEKVADIDIKTLSGEFRKVLGLLELQVKEYQLKKEMDDYIHHQKLTS
ncbi:MAG: hypothetical protein ACTSRI_11325 [Promethearchaeota archaeon]